MTENSLLAIGKIVGIHGIKGNIKVLPYVESIDVFKTCASVLLRSPRDGAGQVVEQTCEIVWAKPHKRIIMMAVKGIETCEAAETLVGFELYIDRLYLPELEDDEYYWSDLIGLTVFSTDNRILGRIVSVFETGSNDVYVVKDGSHEILVPALSSVVLEIDLEKSVMRVDLPPGLE